MVNNGEGSSEEGLEVDAGDFNGGQVHEQVQPQEAVQEQVFLESGGQPGENSSSVSPGALPGTALLWSYNTPGSRATKISTAKG